MTLYYIVLFFFDALATTEIYTLSLHDALPIYHAGGRHDAVGLRLSILNRGDRGIADQANAELDQSSPLGVRLDRKSTRLNSSHVEISYAVFCLKKKKTYEHNKFT